MQVYVIQYVHYTHQHLLLHSLVVLERIFHAILFSVFTYLYIPLFYNL